MVKVELPVADPKYNIFLKGVQQYSLGYQNFQVDTVILKQHKTTKQVKVVEPTPSAQKNRWILRIKLGGRLHYFNKVVAWAYTHKNVLWDTAFSPGSKWEGCHLSTKQGSEKDYTRANLALNTQLWNKRHYKLTARLRHKAVDRP